MNELVTEMLPMPINAEAAAFRLGCRFRAGGRKRRGGGDRREVRARRFDEAIEDLVQSPGIEKLSKSQVSELAKELDVVARARAERPISISLASTRG